MRAPILSVSAIRRPAARGPLRCLAGRAAARPGPGCRGGPLGSRGESGSASRTARPAAGSSVRRRRRSRGGAAARRRSVVSPASGGCLGWPVFGSAHCHLSFQMDRRDREQSQLRGHGLAQPLVHPDAGMIGLDERHAGMTRFFGGGRGSVFAASLVTSGDAGFPGSSARPACLTGEEQDGHIAEESYRGSSGHAERRAVAGVAREPCAGEPCGGDREEGNGPDHGTGVLPGYGGSGDDGDCGHEEQGAKHRMYG